MRDGETLKMYSDRYWKMYNEIDGNFEDVAISIFKVGLPTEHGLKEVFDREACHQCAPAQG